MTIKIYKPSKTAMQSGRGKTKQWLAEYLSEISTSNDSLMNWVSSADTKTQIKLFFDTKEQAIEWLQKAIVLEAGLMEYSKVDRSLDNIRQSPEFQRLMNWP